jgi:hypothetical protein
VTSKYGRHRRCKRMGMQPRQEGATGSGVAANGTETRQLLRGRSACGHMPCRVRRGKAKVLRFGRRSRRDQDGQASGCQRRLDGLMAKVADGAGVRGRRRVLMPNHTDGRANQ